MGGLYLNEIKRLFKLKRTVILSAALYIGAVVLIVYTKINFWNDIMYTFRIQDYMLYVFNAAAGLTVILGLYRLRFTKKTIEQAEECGVKRWKAVTAKWLAGISALAALYLIMALLIIVLGFLSGAHNTAFQLKAMLLSLLMDMLAAIASFSAASFFLFLTAFWLIPAAVYILLMCVYPVWISRWEIRGFSELAYTAAKDAYSAFMLGRSDLKFVPVLLIYMAVPLLLSIIIFRFKRKERRRLKELFKKRAAS